MLIAGWPASIALFTVSLMCANCASRSGWSAPSLVFWLACRRYPRPFSRKSTVRSTISWPIARSAAASLAALLDVQRNGDSGSPRVTGSTKRSRSSITVGSERSSGGLPPPGRLTRPGSSTSSLSSSARPRLTVDSETPVARTTAAIPPRPAERASTATHNRRPRSSNTRRSRNARYRSAIPASSTTPPTSTPQPQTLQLFMREP